MNRLLTVFVWALPFLTFGQFPGNWTEKAAMPTARKEIANAAVSLNDKIYVIGGRTPNGSISNAFEVYDPTTNEWQSLPAYPLSVWRATAASINGKIYVFGGYRIINPFPFNPSNRVFEYDPQNNSWAEKASMPFARGAAAAVALGSKIHLIGGASNTALNSHQVYDPDLNTWSNKANLQQARSGLTANVIGDKIYAAGGYFLSNGVQSRNTLEVYDPAIDQWDFLRNLPIARLGLSSAVVQGRLYVFGGATNTQTPSTTLEYDPVSNSWRQMATTPKRVSFAGAAAIGDRIYLTGGGAVNLSPDGINDLFCFTPDIATDIRNFQKEIPISIFPNPTSNKVTLAYQASKSLNLKVSLFNMMGQEIKHFFLSINNAGRYPIEFGTVPAGLYLLKIENKEQSKTIKLHIQ